MLKKSTAQLLCFVGEETEVHKWYVIFPGPQSQPEAELALKLAGVLTSPRNLFFFFFSHFSRLLSRCAVTSLRKWKLVLKRQELIYCLVQTGKYID